MSVEIVVYDRFGGPHHSRYCVYATGPWAAGGHDDRAVPMSYGPEADACRADVVEQLRQWHREIGDFLVAEEGRARTRPDRAEKG